MLPAASRLTASPLTAGEFGDPHMPGQDLREHRHSVLTHLGERDAPLLTLMAKSRAQGAGERPPLLQAVPEPISDLTGLLAPGNTRR